MSTEILMFLFWILVSILGGLCANLLHDFIGCLDYCMKHKKDRKAENSHEPISRMR